MSISFWHASHRRQTLTYDVVIVGGGIVGCATAYWLQRRRPSLRVAIVEAGTLGAGASGRNAGFILQGTAGDYGADIERYGERTARRLWHFTRANRDLMASELRGNAFGWRAEGSLTVAGDAEEDERLRASVARLRAAGAPVVYRDPDEMNDRIGATGFHGGLYVTTGAVVDPLRLVRHLAAASDASLHTHLPVETLHWDADDGVLLDTPDLRLWGRQVVLAVGPSLPSLVPSLGDYVRPVRGQMLATAPTPERKIPLPVYSHRGGFYVRQREEGEILLGGGRHAHREAEATAVDATTPAVQARLERYLHTHFPWARGVSIRRRWSGTMGFSPDGRPVVGPVPDHADSVFATGFTGHGMGYGFRMGRLLAARTRGKTRPDGYDLFRASRFEEPSSARSASSVPRPESSEA
jgi:glycine/D-amino acid oxidase-like deaminating enzyme